VALDCDSGRSSSSPAASPSLDSAPDAPLDLCTRNGNANANRSASVEITTPASNAIWSPAASCEKEAAAKAGEDEEEATMVTPTKRGGARQAKEERMFKVGDYYITGIGKIICGS
jgi:hypothetical protein